MESMDVDRGENQRLRSMVFQQSRALDARKG